MRLYTLKEVSEITGYAPVTLRKWIYDGKLTSIKSKGGHHRVTEETLNSLLGVKRKKGDKRVIGYCRVSNDNQSDALSLQVEYVRKYMVANGYSFEIITDIGSALNYERQGLMELINRAVNGEVEKVVVLYQDRLVRFGFELLEVIFSKLDVAIEIIDSTDRIEEEELVEDLAQIATEFSSRLQGRWPQKAKVFLKDCREDND